MPKKSDTLNKLLLISKANIMTLSSNIKLLKMAKTEETSTGSLMEFARQ